MHSLCYFSGSLRRVLPKSRSAHALPPLPLWTQWPALLVAAVAFAMLFQTALRDYPLVQGATPLIAVTSVGVNLLTDLVYGIIDPRIRYE